MPVGIDDAITAAAIAIAASVGTTLAETSAAVGAVATASTLTAMTAATEAVGAAVPGVTAPTLAAMTAAEEGVTAIAGLTPAQIAAIETGVSTAGTAVDAAAESMKTGERAVSQLPSKQVGRGTVGKKRWHKTGAKDIGSAPTTRESRQVAQEAVTPVSMRTPEQQVEHAVAAQGDEVLEAATTAEQSVSETIAKEKAAKWQEALRESAGSVTSAAEAVPEERPGEGTPDTEKEVREMRTKIAQWKSPTTRISKPGALEKKYLRGKMAASEAEIV